MRIAPTARRLAVAATAGALLITLLAAAPAQAHTRAERCGLAADRDRKPAGAEWTDAERWVWDQACARRRADFDAHPDRFGADVDDQRRTLSPAFLREVLAEDPFTEWMTGQPLRLRGAWISGGLDLAGTTLAGGLVVESSRIDGTIDLRGATVPGELVLDGLVGSASEETTLDLTDSTVAGTVTVLTPFDAALPDGGDAGGAWRAILDGADIGRSVVLLGIFEDFGGTGAAIGGDFDGALTIFGSLSLARASVGGTVLLDEAGIFGGLDLEDASVGGSVSLAGSAVLGPVDLDNAAIGRDLRLNQSGFGDTVDLDDARIGVDLLADCDPLADEERKRNPRTASEQGRRYAGLDPSAADAAAPVAERPVDGSCLFAGDFLLNGAHVGGAVSAEGVTFGGRVIMRGARVGRGVSVAESSIADLLLLANASIGGDVVASGADLAEFELDAAEVGASVLVDRTVSAAALHMRNATVANDVLVVGNVLDVEMSAAEVGGDVTFCCEFGAGRFLRANIGGELQLRNARFLDGLDLVGATVGGSLSLDEGDYRQGVRLANVQVGQQLSASRAVLDALGFEGGALMLEGAHVAGDVDLSSVLAFDSQAPARSSEQPAEVRAVTLTGATVAGDVLLGDAELDGDVGFDNSRIGGDVDLSAAEVRARVSLNGGQVTGDVVLREATVTGDVPATIAAQDPDAAEVAVMLRGAEVTGGVDLQGAEVLRSVVLEETHVGTDIDLTGATFHGDLSLSDSTVGGVLRFHGEDAGPVQWESSVLDLRGTSVGGVIEISRPDAALDAWPEVRLGGFNYGPAGEADDMGAGFEVATASGEDLAAAPAGDPPERFLEHRFGWYKAWLEKDDDFSRAPYLALEEALRDAGRGNVAENVAIARRDRALSQPGVALWERALGKVHRYTVGYGYRPEWSVYWIIVLVLLGAGATWLMKRRESATDDDGPMDVGNPLLFSVDRLLPVLSLSEKYQRVELEHMTTPFKVYFFAHIFTGYALATALVAAFTGLTGG